MISDSLPLAVPPASAPSLSFWAEHRQKIFSIALLVAGVAALAFGGGSIATALASSSPLLVASLGSAFNPTVSFALTSTGTQLIVGSLIAIGGLLATFFACGRLSTNSGNS